MAVLFVAILTGIGLARWLDFGPRYCLGALTVCIVVYRRRRVLALAGVIVLGITIGGWRGTVFMDRLGHYQPLYNQKIVLVGIAVDDAGYGKQKQLTFDIKDARLNGRGPPLVGKIGVSGFGANVVLRGDTVRAEGKLRAGLGSRQGYMSFATLADQAASPGMVDRFRRNFAAGMASAVPEPAASFGMGLLIGQKTTLPDSVYQDLVMVGLVHIIAVSGYNLTIILQACLKLLGKRSKYQTFVVAVGLIAIFLMITGASASIVRASIVSGLSMVAWYYGRTFRPIVLILVAAAITAMANPLYPWGDIGWYLSFLAFYGVLILSPQVTRRFLRGWFARSVIIGIGLESLCAEIMTLPIVLYVFGQMSTVSLLANIVVAAFVPVAMLFSLIAGLGGMLLTPVSGWLAWPARYILTYMLDAARLLASIPHVFRENVFLSLPWMLGLYCVVVACNIILYLKLKQRPERPASNDLPSAIAGPHVLI